MTANVSQQVVSFRSRRHSMMGAAISELALALVIFAIVVALFLKGGILSGFSAAQLQTDAEAALAGSSYVSPPLVAYLSDGSVEAAEGFEAGLAGFAKHIQSNAKSTTCAQLASVRQLASCTAGQIEITPFVDELTGTISSFKADASSCASEWTDGTGSIEAAIKSRYVDQGCPGVKYYTTVGVFYDESDFARVKVANFEPGTIEVAVGGLPGGSTNPTETNPTETNPTETNPTTEPGDGSCFAAITPVLMADGSYKEIQDINPGDLVLAADDLNVASPRVPARVVQVDMYAAREVLVLKARGEYIVTTKDHPFYVANADVWLPAALLKKGDIMVHADGDVSQIDEIGQSWGKMNVYNLRLAGPHAYFVGKTGLLTHNIGQGAGGGPQQFSASGSEVEVMDKGTATSSNYSSTQNPGRGSDQYFALDGGGVEG